MKPILKRLLIYILNAVLIAGSAIFVYLYAIGEKPIPQKIGYKLTDCYMEKKNCEIQTN